MVLSGPVQRHSTRRALYKLREAKGASDLVAHNTASLLWRASSNSGDLAMSTRAKSVLALQFSKLFRNIHVSRENYKEKQGTINRKNLDCCYSGDERRQYHGMSKMGASKTVVIFQFLHLSIDSLM